MERPVRATRPVQRCSLERNQKVCKRIKRSLSFLFYYHVSRCWLHVLAKTISLTYRDMHPLL